MCRFSTSTVQRWRDTSQFILETQNLVSTSQHEKVFFPPSDSANKLQQQSRAGTMGSANIDIAAPFSLSEQNMEVKADSWNLRNQSPKKTPQRDLNLSFLWSPSSTSTVSFQYFQGDGAPSEMCWAMHRIIRGNKVPLSYEAFLPFL